MCFIGGRAHSTCDFDLWGCHPTPDLINTFFFFAFFVTRSVPTTKGARRSFVAASRPQGRFLPLRGRKGYALTLKFAFPTTNFDFLKRQNRASAAGAAASAESKFQNL